MNRLKRALKKLARKSGSSSETVASGSVASGSAAQLAVPAGSAGASRRSSGSSAGDLAPEARLAARNALFDTYAEAGDEMSFAGVERFFADCDVAIDSFACLALCFRFECKRMGYITRDEFLTGMEALDAATMDHLQDRLADIGAGGMCLFCRLVCLSLGLPWQLQPLVLRSLPPSFTHTFTHSHPPPPTHLPTATLTACRGINQG